MSSALRNKMQRIVQNAGKFHKPKPQLQEAQKKLDNPNQKWDILRGDKVQVIGAHPESGKQGIVLKVLRKQDRVLVQGLNMGKKHIKGDKDRGIAGRVIETERTIHYSNVNLVDPVHNIPTRVHRKILEDGTKVRIAKKSGAIIPRPDILTVRQRPVNSIVTERCTPEDDVWAITYDKYVPPSRKWILRCGRKKEIVTNLMWEGGHENNLNFAS